MDAHTKIVIEVLTENRVKHFYHCYSYKKIVMKIMEPFQLPFVLSNYIFTYVGCSSF